MLNCSVAGARQSFQFFRQNKDLNILRQNTWFLENSRALSKFLCGIFALLNKYYQIITTTVHKKTILFQPRKPL